MRRSIMDIETEGVHLEPDLGCPIQSVTYNYVQQTAYLHIPPHCCTDMEAAIDLALDIDWGCLRVYVFEGGNLDMVYHRVEKKQWQAQSCRTLKSNMR